MHAQPAPCESEVSLIGRSRVSGIATRLLSSAVPERPFTDAEIDAAVEALSDPDRFREAESRVARVAPQLQRILSHALDEGGWFGEAHDGQVLKAATTPDPDERITGAHAAGRGDADRHDGRRRGRLGAGARARFKDDRGGLKMDIRFLGHACFELSDGDTRVLIDPFLTGNPKAAVSADEVDPTHIFLTHGHADHIGDTVDIAKRTGAQVVAIVELAERARRAGRRERLRPEHRRHGRVRLGLGEARAGVAHVDDAERAREHAGRGS